MRIESIDDLRIGLPALDAEHMTLVDLCNEFIDSVRAGVPVATLAEGIERLVNSTRQHFESEEKLLDRHNHPGLAAHKAEHERLMAQAGTLMAQFADLADDNHARSVAYEAATFLRAWLIEHIRLTDLPCRPFLMRLV